MRRRSETWTLIDEVQSLVEQFYALADEQRKVFLDTVDPLPNEPEAKPVKKAKKKASKPRQVNVDSAAKRRRGLPALPEVNAQLNGSQRCTATIPDTDTVCEELQGSPVHDSAAGYIGYHLFQSPSNVVSVGGG